MLHELLLALSGHHGAVFAEVEGCGLQIVADLPWMTASENALFNRLCRLGQSYGRYQELIQIQEDITVPSQGHYWKAVCDGLRNLLRQYEQALVKLEQEVLENPHLALTHVQCALESYQTLFPALDSLLDHLQRDKAHGCHILEVLHQHSSHGDAAVQAAIQQLQASCHQVLFRQLASWLLHGVLADPQGEFFIQPVTDAVRGRDLPDGAALSSAGLRMARKKAARKKEAKKLHRPEVEHRVEMALLPSYIPVRLALKVLFIGESLQMLSAEGQGERELRDAGSVSLFGQQEMHFARQLLSLQQLTGFDLLQVEETISDIHHCISEQLWHFVVEDAKLLSQLKLLKDYFFLGRGELFSLFCVHSNKLLRGLPTANTEHDINTAFHQSHVKLGIEEEETSLAFQLTITMEESQKPSTGTSRSKEATSNFTGWQCLGLSYLAAWPLHLVFTEKALISYNTLFQFLLSVKRAELSLHHCWTVLMDGKAESLVSMTEDDRQLRQLRAELALFVNNLQYYLQVDVLEAQYTLLVERVRSTHDFEEIRHAHEHYLTTLLSQCFRFSSPVGRCLGEILQLAHLLRDLLLRQRPWGEPEKQQFTSIQTNFRRHHGLLFKILSSVRSHHANSQLAQLLLRGDFNRYYSNQYEKSSVREMMPSDFPVVKGD